MGKPEKSEESMNQLIAEYGDNGLYQQAQVHAQRNESALAMECLLRAYDYGDAGLTYLFIDPLLNPLREREDFKRLQRGLGFT